MQPKQNASRVQSKAFMFAVIGAGCLLALLAGSRASAEDEVELLSGMKVHGKILKETESEISIESSGAVMAFDTTKICAITTSESRRVLHEKPAATKAPPPPTSPPAKSADPVAAKTTATPPETKAPPATHAPAAAAAGSHTKEEVDAAIEQAGKAPPDWFSGVQLNYPKTLDLTWGNPKGRNSQTDMGEYFWSVVNPNEARWKEGIKLLHQALNVNKADPAKLKLTMNLLGECYHNLLADHARAAFWWRKSGRDDENMADCYFRLGNKDMAREILQKYGDDDTQQGSVIKLWADIGDYDSALKLCETKKKSKLDIAYLMEGETYRLMGKYKEAIDVLEKTATVQPGQTSNAPPRLQRNKDHAKDYLESIKVYELLDLKKIPDGTYTSSCLGYVGQVTIAVTVKGSHITEVKVTQHQEHQYYASMTVIPAKIIEKQSVKGVDTYSSATITSNAIISATAKALASGMK